MNALCSPGSFVLLDREKSPLALANGTGPGRWLFRDIEALRSPSRGAKPADVIGINFRDGPHLVIAVEYLDDDFAYLLLTAQGLAWSHAQFWLPAQEREP